jgi:hypothetical protein
MSVLRLRYTATLNHSKNSSERTRPPAMVSPTPSATPSNQWLPTPNRCKHHNAPKAVPVPLLGARRTARGAFFLKIRGSFRIDT